MRMRVLAIAALVLGCAGRLLHVPRLVEGPERAVEIAYDVVGETIVVPVRLGSDPQALRFVLDLTRDGTIVTPALAARLGLPLRGAVAGNGVRVPRASLPDLHIASYVFTGAEALVMDVASLAVPVDGVLGRASFGSLVVRIDPEKGVLHVARSAALL